jgi:hypothetical protein
MVRINHTVPSYRPQITNQKKRQKHFTRIVLYELVGSDVPYFDSGICAASRNKRATRMKCYTVHIPASGEKKFAVEWISRLAFQLV